MPANILGGEFNGIEGTRKHSLEKGQAFVMRVSTIVSANAVSQVTLQNVAGHFCFMASFRRVLFSVLQDIFVDIHRFFGQPKAGDDP